MGIRAMSATLAVAAATVGWTLACAQPVERPDLVLGDIWTYRVQEGPTMNGGSLTFTEFTIVTNIFPKQYEMSWVRTAHRDGERTKGIYRTSRDFNRYARALPTDAWQELDSWRWPLEIGRSWRYEIPNQAGTQTWEARIEGWEEISVPAGKFKTVRVTYDLVRHPNMLVGRSIRVWFSPDARAIARVQDRAWYEATHYFLNNSRELESYQLH